MSQQYHQYFATRPRISIIMPSGERIHFQAGQYVTDNEKEIKFLDEQVAARHPMIYVKKGAETVTAEQLDPLQAVKEKAIAEYLAKQQAQQDPSRDMGNTANNGAGVDASGMSTTKSISSITVGSKSK